MAKKKKGNSRVIVYGLLLMVLIVGGGWYYNAMKPVPHVHLKLHEMKLGNIEYDYLAGSNETLEDIMKKEYVLMVLFTLNNPDMKANIKTLNQLNKRDDLAVIGYMMSGTKRAEKYAKNYNVQFPIAKASKHYMKTFDIHTVPNMFLVRTSDLKVRDKYVGALIEHKVITKMKDTF